jgi:hypothetical protein
VFRVKRLAATLIVLALYLLHQDIWFWRAARPVVLGVLPVGLFYHVAYTVATALALWVLVRLVWPSHLDTADRTGG